MFRIRIHKQCRVNELDNFGFVYEESYQELFRKDV